MRFAHPQLLALLLAVPVIAVLMYRARGRMTPKMLFSSVQLLGSGATSFKERMRSAPKVMTLLALTLMILAIARPQSPWRETRRKVEGIDIMLVTDVSQSMGALDFKPNRLENAKAVMKDFIKGRENDQIGLVIFSNETYTLCPLTQDYPALESFIDRIDFDLTAGTATAIGMGLANGVNKLKDSPAESKVIILLTDGENNHGEIAPLEAAEIARRLNVRCYTIGIGSRGMVPIDVRDDDGRSHRLHFSSRIDIPTLQKIADMTGGQFFAAEDNRGLEEIFEQIDQLEKTEFEVNEMNYFDELAHYLMVPAFLIFAVAFVLDRTWLWSFP